MKSKKGRHSKFEFRMYESKTWVRTGVGRGREDGIHTPTTLQRFTLSKGRD